MARTRYELYAAQAKSDGYLRAADFFTEAARQEFQHGKRMYLALQGNPVIGNWKIQQPQLSNTTRNLELSIQNEHTEWQIIYPHFADIAAGEGFSSLAAVCVPLPLRKNTMKSGSVPCFRMCRPVPSWRFFTSP